MLSLAYFDALQQQCHAFIAATPSTHFNIRWYGGAFADFLPKHATAQPALAALAELEWRLGLAFDAADERVATAAGVSAIATGEWPHLRFALHGSLQRQLLDWNVSELRRAYDSQKPFPPLAAWHPARHWVAWRNGVTVHHRCMDGDKAAALDAIAKDLPFAQICECLCEWHTADTVATRVAELLRRWIDDGWISGLRTKGAP